MSARRLVGARVLADEQGEAGCSGRIEVARWSIICFLTAACRSIEVSEGEEEQLPADGEEQPCCPF
ncbi:Os05g0105401 [Oryza sativa Japonica Group]|uniref:Os05g0105401 protein n=2 Tax=Oryza sativa TaxID=4530 RepID=A0A0P0WGZ2_ORYSJ|nr:hypothetical protein OsI_18116 [Oryza sativa Indica Group]KAB8097743.1 hypothetical protein EE612_026552 [Oryza sativa]BAS91867.1 Os05g0105401 [Oryza sativa Japonica Group]